jgi:hypothetical protein
VPQFTQIDLQLLSRTVSYLPLSAPPGPFLLPVRHTSAWAVFRICEKQSQFLKDIPALPPPTIIRVGVSRSSLLDLLVQSLLKSTDELSTEPRVCAQVMV